MFVDFSQINNIDEVLEMQELLNECVEVEEDAKLAEAYVQEREW